MIERIIGLTFKDTDDKDEEESMEAVSAILDVDTDRLTVVGSESISLIFEAAELRALLNATEEKEEA